MEKTYIRGRGYLSQFIILFFVLFSGIIGNMEIARTPPKTQNSAFFR
jgi:hypothetical protein